jgi:predicted negative regulator of RcsB-dependent stress response
MEKETKEQRFARLATARVNKAIKAIRVVGKLANSNTNTEYATKIVAALVAAVDLVEAQFQPKTNEDEKPGFAL